MSVKMTEQKKFEAWYSKPRTQVLESYTLPRVPTRQEIWDYFAHLRQEFPREAIEQIQKGLIKTMLKEAEYMRSNQVIDTVIPIDTIGNAVKKSVIALEVLMTNNKKEGN